MIPNRFDIREAAAFYRSAALAGETVTGHEYDEAFAQTGSGICPNCNNPIEAHAPGQRKRCHDALSGFQRDERPGADEGWPRDGIPLNLEQ